MVVIQLSGILTFEYWQRIEAPTVVKRFALHTAIIDREAPYQFRYRILIPTAAEVLAQTLHRVAFHGQPPSGWPYSRRAFQAAYILLNGIAIAAFLLFLHLLICEWWEAIYGLFGMALAAVIMVLTFRDHYFHPWSFWEAALFAAGMWMIRREHYWVLSLFAVGGAFIRETTVFLPLAFVFYAVPKPFSWAESKGRTMRFALTSLLLWLAAYGIVHATVGYKPTTFTIDMAVEGNLSNFHYVLILNLLVLGPVWLLAIRGLFRSHRLIQRFALALIPYLLLLGAIGFWWEIRYWLTALPVLIPAVVFGLHKQSARLPAYEPN